MEHNIGKTTQKMGHSVNLERVIFAVEVGSMPLALATDVVATAGRNIQGPITGVSPAVADPFSNYGARVRICQ